MKISELIQGRSGKVESVGPRATLGEANTLMAERDIGAVIVRDLRSGYLGVLSERDIARQIAAQGPEALRTEAVNLMSSSPPACKPTDDVQKVMETMTMRRIRHVPVVEGGEVTGIVSIGDVVKHMLDEAKLELGVLRDYARSH